LLQAIAAAQNLQPSALVGYLDTLHLVVPNFESVRGTFPLAFLHQLLLVICAYHDTELFEMDTTPAFISAALTPGAVIYCKICTPPLGVDIGIGSNGLVLVWKLQAPLEGTRPAAIRWTQSSNIPIKSFEFAPIGSGVSFWMYSKPSDEMLLCPHVDEFLLSTTTLALTLCSYDHYSRHCACKFFVAGTFDGLDIVRDCDASKMYLSQAALIDILLEQEFSGIMSSEHLTSHDLRYNPGQMLHKWEQICPWFTPFDYKMPKLSVVDSPEVPDLGLVHWMQVIVGTLMSILNSSPDLTHSVHDIALFVHNPGSAHVKALDNVTRHLAGTVDLCFLIGNWTTIDHWFLAGLHVNADASHKNVALDNSLDFLGITGIGLFAFGTLLLVCSFVQDQVAASSCEAKYYSYNESYSAAVNDLANAAIDSVPAMAMSQGPPHRSHTLQIDFTLALARDYIQRGKAVMEYCPTAEQVADIWTKQMGSGSFIVFRGRFMGLIHFLLS
jgi:hypothetical protein